MAPRKKIKIAIALFLFLIFVFVVFLVYPLLKEIKKSSKDFLSERANFLSLEREIKNLKEFKDYLKENRKNLEKVKAVFVDPETPIDFIKFLEKLSKNCQIDLKISPASLAKIGKGQSALGFQLTLVGSFPQFLKFLDKLQSGLYLIKIEKLDIKRLTKEELKKPELKDFSLGDIEATLFIKVLTK